MKQRFGLSLLLPAVLFPASGWAATGGINPLPLIAQAESGGNPTAVNGSLGSSATGLYQMVSGTWAAALQDCGCGTTGQYPQAADAPASLQTAAAAALIQNNGLSDWTCSGCDAPFTAEVQADGGASAFQTSGLSTNPADYSSLDNPSGLQSFLGSTGTASDGGITVSDGSLSTSGPTGGVTIASPLGSTSTTTAGGSSVTPFSWVWSNYQSAVQTPLSNDIGAVLADAAQPLRMLLILDLAIVGGLIAVGVNNFNHLWRRFFKILIVLGLIGAANVYQSDFVAVVTSLPAWLSQGIISRSATGPAGSFDNVSSAFLSAVHTAWAQVPWGTEMFLDAGLFVIAFIIVYGAELIMFGVWFVSQVITQILLIIGPILVLALLSEYLSEIFIKYIKILLLMALVAFVVNIMAVLALQVMSGTLNAISPNSAAGALVVATFDAAIAIAAMAAAVVVLPRVLEHLAGAAGVPSMATAGNALRAAVSRIPGVGNAVSGAAAASAKNIGSSSSTAFGPMRSVTPAGRSLSK